MTENAHTPKIEFAKGGKARFREVPLAYPLLIDGEELKAVTIRRLAAREVKALQETMDENGFVFERLIQPFTDQPQEVLDALDQDDFAEVAETVIDFLPAKMREELEGARAKMEALIQQRMEDAADAEASPPGDASSPTSPTPSNGTKTTS